MKTMKICQTNGKTCIDCVWGEYHPARPTEVAYVVCHHPRVACREVEVGQALPCRYWLFRMDAGMDAAGMDAVLMSYDQWREHWECDHDTGELVTV